MFQIVMICLAVIFALPIFMIISQFVGLVVVLIIAAIVNTFSGFFGIDKNNK